MPGRTDEIRLAVWSGPRNVSTALMRSFEQRPDTVVVDEPFYAYYLARTGKSHPGREEVIAAGETDWRRVVAALRARLPPGKSLVYQKHMAHHLLEEIDRGWLDEFEHVFLLRDPERMLASLARVLPEPPQLADTGLPQQLELFERAAARGGRVPPVLDAADLLADPRRALTELCDRVGIAFDERMLRWPAGRRPTDGVWARYWYGAVERSTGFGPPPSGPVDLDAVEDTLLDECRRIHALMARHRIARRG